MPFLHIEVENETEKAFFSSPVRVEKQNNIFFLFTFFFLKRNCILIYLFTLKTPVVYLNEVPEQSSIRFRLIRSVRHHEEAFLAKYKTLLTMMPHAAYHYFLDTVYFCKFLILKILSISTRLAPPIQ
jgi:hypothetical protein